ncbi:MAG TPA: dicarboxylate/amino acid:cation symporter [Verrucomicrobiales bacterium]|nr:dicarboxylate/amino acid:cation symporter [Verrucomicrobiales bacterium]
MKAHWQILTGLLAAVLLGTALNMALPADPAAEMPGWIAGLIQTCGFIGDLFLNALKMVIVPLITASIVTGVAGLGRVEGFGRLGLKTVVYFTCSSVLAILTGLLLVNTLKPGLEDGAPSDSIADLIEAEGAKLAAGADPERQTDLASAEARDAGDAMDVFRRMIPTNIVANASDNSQMLGLIFFSILFGLAMTRLAGSLQDTLLTFFQAVSEVMILITRWIMLFAPLGVFALVLPQVAEVGLRRLFGTLLVYFLTVAFALSFHLLVVLPLLLRLIGGVNPWRHFAAMRTAMLTAFSTASSAATLPVTLRGVRDAGVSNRVSSFVVPLGATVNMDGTALYECVAVIFIAQVLGVDLPFSQQFVVVTLALLTSIGVAGIPSASLVAILIILGNVPVIPPAAVAPAVALLFAVDRPLDMFRTAVNVFSDSCGAVIIARTEGEDGVLAKTEEA